MDTMKVSRPTLVTAPTIQPLQLSEAKQQCRLASSETAFDDELSDLIDQVAEQWEHDTDTCLMLQTLMVNMESFCDDGIYLPSRPISSIASIKYYDANNVQQTIATTVYGLDAVNRCVRLKLDQVWPTVADRWDAIEIRYVCGVAAAISIPQMARRAMLLLLQYYFDANRGDNDKPNDLRAYQNLVTRCMRSNYP